LFYIYFAFISKAENYSYAYFNPLPLKGKGFTHCSLRFGCISLPRTPLVSPARWIPAFAGMTALRARLI